MKTPSPFPLRMSDELRAILDSSSKNNSRSMNAEIVYRLEKSLYQDEHQCPYPITVQPSLSASTARKISRQNEELGLSIALCDAIDKEISAACLIGKNIIELNITEFTSGFSVKDTEINSAIPIIKNAFELEGYNVTISDKLISVSF